MQTEQVDRPHDSRDPSLEPFISGTLATRAQSHDIDPEAARNVLWFYDGTATGGWEPGDFTKHLIRAIQHADTTNRLYLSYVYPDLVYAVILATNFEKGLDMLRGIITDAEV